LDLTIICTFGDEDPLETVKAIVHYTRLQREEQAEALFDRGHTMARIRADLSALSERTYTVEALVFYRGDPQPTLLSFPPSDASIAVLDVDRLGVLDVAARLGDVPFDRIRHVALDLVHIDSNRATTMVLNAATPEATWRVVIRDRPRQWRYRAAWILTDDTRV